ncbi:MAG: hypothetical protein ACPGU0_08035 [Marinirhabdus sp.]
MSRCAVLFALLFFGPQAVAQKLLQKTIDVAGVSGIEIRTGTVHKITVISQARSTVFIEAKVAGETFEHAMLRTAVANGILEIGMGQVPFFKAEDDKLAAHKVLAIEITIAVPRHFTVLVHAAMALVDAWGHFKNFDAALGTGNCNLNHFYGNASVRTKSGGIYITSLPGVGAVAVSKKGAVTNQLPLMLVQIKQFVPIVEL